MNNIYGYKYQISLRNDALINCYWYNPVNKYDANNWGDALNPVLISKISGDKVNYTKLGTDIQKYVCIGSILQKADAGSIIWGSGFLSHDRKLATKPLKICAVRGPLSRNIILAQGYECPQVFGDPALLYPRFYKSQSVKKYKIGIIPHYVDATHPWIAKYVNQSDIKVIDILSGINKVVDEINQCELIISSSLHGIIAGDAYGVPSFWVKFSDKVLGNGFKFLDYFQSVNRDDVEPIVIHDNISIDDIIKNVKKYDFKINLDDLYDACPFKK